MKRILALPTCQKICSDKEPEQIDFGKFDLGHPVYLLHVRAIVHIKYQVHLYLLINQL